MQRNLSKYQAIVMGKLKASIEFHCENTTIPNCEEIELLGITMDNKLKFEKHIAKICRKVSQQTAVLKRMRNILPFEIRSKIYMCFIGIFVTRPQLINWKKLTNVQSALFSRKGIHPTRNFSQNWDSQV